MARRKVRNRGKLEVSPKRRKANKIQQNWFEINEILRKAEMVSTGGQVGVDTYFFCCFFTTKKKTNGNSFLVKIFG